MLIDSFKGTCKLKSTHHIFNKEDGRGVKISKTLPPKRSDSLLKSNVTCDGELGEEVGPIKS